MVNQDSCKIIWFWRILRKFFRPFLCFLGFNGTSAPPCHALQLSSGTCGSHLLPVTIGCSSGNNEALHMLSNHLCLPLDSTMPLHDPLDSTVPTASSCHQLRYSPLFLHSLNNGPDICLPCPLPAQICSIVGPETCATHLPSKSAEPSRRQPIHRSRRTRRGCKAGIHRRRSVTFYIPVVIGNHIRSQDGPYHPDYFNFTCIRL